MSTIDPNTKQIRCHDERCTAVVCEDCIPLLLRHCLDIGTVPKCANVTCSGRYLISSLRLSALIPRSYTTPANSMSTHGSTSSSSSQQNPPEDSIVQLFHECVIKGLSNSSGDEARKINEFQALIERLRKERLEFINREVPKGVAEIAKICFRSKLNAVDKTRRQRLQRALVQSKRVCMNVLCDGSLDMNLRCMKCESVFCKDCEARIIVQPHRCKPEDLESIKLQNETTVPCPNCAVRIQRSWGCNHMTCAACKTNFDYSTGTIGGGGNHQTYDGLNLAKTRMLTEVYADQLRNDRDLTSALTRVESHAIPTPDPVTIEKAVAEYQRTQNASKLVSSYCRFIATRHKANKFVRVITELETLLRAGTLTLEDVELVESKL